MRIAAVLLIAVTAVFAQEQGGSVQGTVLDSVTHQPIKKVTVSIHGTDFNMSKTAVTDASGSFAFDQLPAGHWLLLTHHAYYASGRDGNFGAMGRGKSLEVKAGQAADPVTLELIPGASVSGRIFDEDGEPLRGCPVQARAAKTQPGRNPVQGGQPSNEDGEYRIDNIPAGKYIVTAQCRTPVFQPRPFSSGPDPPPRLGYPRQFYPLASDPKSAQVIELAAGTEKGGIDFQMKPAPVTQVRGTFAATGADWHGSKGWMLQLVPADSSGTSQSVGGSIDIAQGTFQFRQVFPGSYFVTAFSNDVPERRVGAIQPVEVRDTSLDIVLELKRPIDITGTIEVEGNPAGRSLQPMNVQLVPDYVPGLPIPQAQAQVRDDGAFTLKGVIPALWKLNVSAAGAFLKSARLGGTEITGRRLDLSSGVAENLKIVLSTNTGTITGAGIAGQMLSVQSTGADVPMINNIQVDQTGHFKLEGVAPGKYRIIAMDAPGPIPDEGGQEIEVHEGETVTVEVKLQSAN